MRKRVFTIGSVLITATLGVVFLARQGWPSGRDFQLTIAVELGEDEGQSLGTLFKSTFDGWEVGAGFVDAHSTYLRDNHRVLSFYARPSAVQYSRVNLGRPIGDLKVQGARVLVLGDRLLAFHQVWSPFSLKVFEPASATWKEATDPKIPEKFAGLQVVADKVLVFASDSVEFDGALIFQDRAWENYFYFADAKLYAYQVRKDASRLLTCRWNGKSKARIDETTCLKTPLPRPGSFPITLGHFKDELIIGTNIGQVHKVRDGVLTSLIDHPAETSWQGYSMMQWNDLLLIGQYPDGNVFKYDGTTVSPFDPPVPVVPGSNEGHLEAQTLTVHGGELYVGVWSWGAVWKLNETTKQWQFLGRLFDNRMGPAASRNEPYRNEMIASYPALWKNAWGQRIANLTNFGDGLVVTTFNKSGEWREPKKPEFMPDRVLNQYGAVTLLRGVPQVSCQIKWRKTTRFHFTVHRTGKLTVLQDGQELCSAEVDLKDFAWDGTSASLTIGSGAYGRAFAPDGVRSSVRIEN